MNKCKECETEFLTFAALLLHLRSHKMSQAAYFQKHEPRYDKLTHGIIFFKNRDFYFNADFNSRGNAIQWLKSVDRETARDYLVEYLRKRHEEKNIIYIPSQVELRSLPTAATHLMNEIFGDFYSAAEALGMKRRFDNLSFSGVWKVFSPKHKIIVDTREQKPLTFSIKTQNEALKFGDYKLNDDKFSCDCVIERKSLSDFYSTLSGEFKRFEKEIKKSKNAYLIVVVEDTMDSVIGFINQPQVRGKINISHEFVFHNMRELMQKYDNLQFLFVKNREEASIAIEKLFRCNGQFKKVDVQYAYDMGNLI